jgi:hypothetical protein
MFGSWQTKNVEDMVIWGLINGRREGITQQKTGNLNIFSRRVMSFCPEVIPNLIHWTNCPFPMFSYMLQPKLEFPFALLFLPGRVQNAHG